MRDPETRRGVPLRAGVSLVAVAATVAATFALAGPASAAVTSPTITASPSGAITEGLAAAVTATVSITTPASDTPYVEVDETTTDTAATSGLSGTVTVGSGTAQNLVVTSPSAGHLKGTLSVDMSAASAGTNTLNISVTSSQPGSVTVHVATDSTMTAQDTATYNVIPATASVAITPSGTSSGTTGAATSYSVKAEDSGANAIDGATVKLTATQSGTTPTVSPSSVTTNASGVGAFTVTTSQPGTVTVTAQAVDSDGNDVSGIKTVNTETVTSIPSGITLTPSTGTSYTDGAASDSAPAVGAAAWTVPATGTANKTSSVTYSVTTPQKGSVLHVRLTLPAADGSTTGTVSSGSPLSTALNDDSSGNAVATKSAEGTKVVCATAGPPTKDCTIQYDATITENADQNSFTFNSTSLLTGTVSVMLAPDNGSDGPAASPRVTATQTVLAQNAAGANYDVTNLASSPTSYTGYSTDTNIPFTITATGKNGAAIAGATVKNSINNTTETTASDGTADFTFNGSDLTNVSSIVFSVNNVANTSVSVPVSITNVGTVWEVANHATLSTPSDNTTPADTVVAGSAVDIPFSITLHNTTSTNTEGSGASGIKVAFDAKFYAQADCAGAQQGKTQRVTATTDASGDATGTISASALQAQNGYSVCVQALLSNSSTAGTGQAVSTSKTVNFASPEFGVVTNDVQSVPGQTVAIPVSVQDQFGNYTTNADNLSYTVTSGPNKGVAGSVTLSGGKATVKYTATNGSVGDQDVVSISDLSHPNIHTPTASANVSYVKSVTPGSLTFGTGLSATKSVNAKNTQTGTVTLKSDQGDLLVGQTVTVSVDNGFVSDTANTNSGKQSVDVTTDNSGVATFYVGSESAAKQTITAAAGSVTATDKETVTYNALAPYSVTLTGPAKGNVALNGTGTFTAKVTDEFGNGISGVDVQFSQTGAGRLSGGVTPLTVATGTNGTVSVTLDAGSTVGSGSVTATYADNNTAFASASDSDATVTYQKTDESKYTVGQGVSKVKVDGIKGVGVGGTEKIAVRVWGADGNVASNETVNVTVTGANKASGTATTGANGELGWFNYTAKNAGTDHITATIDGKTATTTVTISSAVSSHLFHPVAQANGTFLFSVQTIPATKGARVNLFAVYHPGKSDQALFHAGNGVTNAAGRAARATSPGYLVNGHFKHYRAGQTYVLVAKVAGSPGQSNMSSATAK